jgi:hypothetical protein
MGHPQCVSGLPLSAALSRPTHSHFSLKNREMDGYGEFSFLGRFAGEMVGWYSGPTRGCSLVTARVR